MESTKKYNMIFDMGHTVDGVEFPTFDGAKCDAIETLITWECEEQRNWALDSNGTPCPTQEQIESWDMMINNCCVYVTEWDEENGDWFDCEYAWFPSYEEEYDIDWLEWNELKKKYNW